MQHWAYFFVRLDRTYVVTYLIFPCFFTFSVGKKEKDYGGWDKDPLKDYSENAMENGGADLPLM